MMKSDKNGNKTLDIGEYKTFIMEMLQEAGIEITEANKTKIEELINNSFTSMDTIQQDGELTKEELTLNAQKVIEQLTDDIGNINSSTIQPSYNNYIDNPNENHGPQDPNENLMA